MTTSGNVTSIVSRPPSISRLTVALEQASAAEQSYLRLRLSQQQALLDELLGTQHEEGFREAREREHRAERSDRPGAPAERPERGEREARRHLGRGAAFRLEVKQRYQQLEGRLVRNAQVMTVRDAQIDGARIRFSAPGADGRLETYTGTVQDGRITGEARAGNGAALRWSATRVP